MQYVILRSPFITILQVMDEVHAILKEACVGDMTKDILSKAQTESRYKHYFDDFLGNGDTNIFNRTVVSCFLFFCCNFYHVLHAEIKSGHEANQHDYTCICFFRSGLSGIPKQSYTNDRQQWKTSASYVKTQTIFGSQKIVKGYCPDIGRAGGGGGAKN